jgi:hypothetical protein
MSKLAWLLLRPGESLSSLKRARQVEHEQLISRTPVAGGQ